jgi:protein required for attachment to host cells
MMTKASERLLATVDERQARLFRCTPTMRGTWRLEETHSLRSPWEEDHERRRPAILGRGPETMPPHEAAFGHEEEEERRRFARDVADWLRKHAPPSGADPLLVFAAPRFLGLMREGAAELDRVAIRLMESELSRLHPHELAEHPAVVALLSRERVA